MYWRSLYPSYPRHNPLNTPHPQYLSNRILKLNVGFLLAEGPGNSHESRIDVPEPMMLADDLTLNYIRGSLRLSHTKEGVLVQSHLHVGVFNECPRCLDPIEQDLEIDIEELYATKDVDSAEFTIGQHGILDLAPLLRAEILIALSQPVLCKEDCLGLCPECGANRNRESCTCELDNIDPRMTELKKLLDSMG